MSRRGIIVSSLIDSISASTGSTGHRGMRFLHEINDFPAFYVHPANEGRVHVGDGMTFGVLSLAIRGYQWADSLDDVDAYGRALETAVQTFFESNRELVEEARVTSFQTDEGVMEPYGSVDLSVTILYDALDFVQKLLV